MKSSPLNGYGRDDELPEKPNLKGDRLNFYILMILYIIQGFPIGLSSALTVILQSNPLITFADQVSINIILNINSSVPLRRRRTVICTHSKYFLVD